MKDIPEAADDRIGRGAGSAAAREIWSRIREAHEAGGVDGVTAELAHIWRDRAREFERALSAVEKML